MKTYDEWKTTEPDYWDYDDGPEEDDPVVELERLLGSIKNGTEALRAITAADRMLVYGYLREVHKIYTDIALVCDQYPNMLPRQAAE